MFSSAGTTNRELDESRMETLIPDEPPTKIAKRENSNLETLQKLQKFTRFASGSNCYGSRTPSQRWAFRDTKSESSNAESSKESPTKETSKIITNSVLYTPQKSDDISTNSEISTTGVSNEISTKSKEILSNLRISITESTEISTNSKTKWDNNRRNGDEFQWKNSNSNSSTEPKFQTRKEKWREMNSKFPYGNYNRYYGKRADFFGHSKESQTKFDDERLRLFKSEWFENKKVLDIGCNIGYVTMEIASRFAPSSIVGVDIDADLIRTANNILRKKCQNAASSYFGMGKIKKKDQDVDKSHQEGGSGETSKRIMITDGNSAIGDQGSAIFDKTALLKRVRFENGNYVLEDDSLLEFVRPEYDAILALSLTKWIHLNWGDCGMKRFFKRVYLHLKPAGIFILEPQAWDTYKRRKALTPQIANNYNNIRFKPDRFRSYLLSEEIGFESCQMINKLESEGKGFTRPIFLFRKPTADKANQESKEPMNQSELKINMEIAKECEIDKGNGRMESSI